MSRRRRRAERREDRRPGVFWSVEAPGRPLVVVAASARQAVRAAGGREIRERETWPDGYVRFSAVERGTLRRESFYVRRLREAVR